MAEREFRTLVVFTAFAKRAGARVKKVTTAKSHVYHQAIHPELGIIGFFTEQLVAGQKSYGHLHTPSKGDK